MTFVRPNVAAMQGYVYGEQPLDSKVIKLNTNENPYPPSSKLRSVFDSFDPCALRVYPDATAVSLRETIANRNSLRPDQVVITNGADEAIRLVFSTFFDPGEVMATTEPGYGLYGVFGDIHETSILLTDLNADWQLPLDAVDHWNAVNAKAAVLINPHAPCGTFLSQDRIEILLKRFKGILILDEAYVDFVDPKIAFNSADLLTHHANLLILRTFSKGYSLAGIRVGYILGAVELLDPILNKTRDSYNVDAVAQRVAQCAFEDQSYAKKTHDVVRSERARMQEHLKQQGFRVQDSEANFLLVEHSKKQCVESVVRSLRDHSILVRYFNTPRMNHAFRLTIGTAEQNDRVLHVLGQLPATA